MFGEEPVASVEKEGGNAGGKARDKLPEARRKIRAEKENQQKLANKLKELRNEENTGSKENSNSNGLSDSKTDPLVLDTPIVLETPEEASVRHLELFSKWQLSSARAAAAHQGRAARGEEGFSLQTMQEVSGMVKDTKVALENKHVEDKGLPGQPWQA
jgi:hypothetical protein